MTSLSDLETAYNKYLEAKSPVSSSGQANDAFEIYTLSLVLKAAKNEGASIKFHSQSSNTKPSKLIFRSSPGTIYSKAHDYCHALIEFPNNLSYESHVGVYVEGLAGVVHECDVLVINANEGEFCRRNNVHPKKSSTILTAECKFYTGNLGIQLGREFLGITVDLGREARYFLSNSSGKSIDRVLAHHKRDRFFGLSPLNKDAEEQTISLFRNTFRNQISKLR